MEESNSHQQDEINIFKCIIHKYIFFNLASVVIYVFQQTLKLEQVDTHYVGYELSLSYRTIELYTGSNIYMHIFKARAHRCQMSPS